MEIHDARRAVARAMPGGSCGHAINHDIAVAHTFGADGDAEKVHHVRVLKLRMGHEHEDQPVYADLRYAQTFEEAFDAGYHFRYLAEKLAKAPTMPLPDNPLEREIAKREQMEAYAQICRFGFVEEMKEDARRLAAGETDYPPEESILGKILKEIDALP